MIQQIDGLIGDFITVAKIAGLELNAAEIRHQSLPSPHRPASLPGGMRAVYVFSLPAPLRTVLKVGKVGPNSGARFVSQHYSPASSNSNLAKSLLADAGFWQEIKTPQPMESQIGEWIKRNVDRDNFFISAQHGGLALGLLEVFIQCRLQPRYEG